MVLWLAAALPVLAQPALTERDRTAMQDTIARQIEAFRADDGALAFSLATPGIRAVFGDAESFMRMVRSGYAAVYRPREFRFRDTLALGEGWAQTALVVGPDGVAMLAIYPMRRQPDGRWLIDGCELVPLPDRTT